MADPAGTDAAPPEERDAAPGLSGPPYQQQPVDAERPVPLRGRPERTQHPEDWDDARVDEEPGRDDDADEELARRTKDSRRSHAEGRAGDGDTEVDRESGYSTEQVQGAAQPGPDV